MWGVSFSGGGQRGLAHLGVIKGLQQDGVLINAVSGSSVGAIMAGALAINIPYKTLEDMVLSLNSGDMLDVRLNLWNFLKTYFRLVVGKFNFQDTAYWSLLKGERLAVILRKIYGDIEISEIKKPIAITSVDLNCGMDVVFTNKPQAFKNFQGLIIDDIPLYLAIRASIAIPLLYQGVSFKGCYLVDGGLTNNLPINLVKLLGAEHVISVEVAKRPPFGKKPSDIVDLGGRLITIAVDNSKYYTQADVSLEPQLPEVSLGNFSQTKELIDKGHIIYMKNREKILKIY